MRITKTFVFVQHNDLLTRCTKGKFWLFDILCDYKIYQIQQKKPLMDVFTNSLRRILVRYNYRYEWLLSFKGCAALFELRNKYPLTTKYQVHHQLLKTSGLYSSSYLGDIVRKTNLSATVRVMSSSPPLPIPIGPSLVCLGHISSHAILPLYPTPKP